MDVLTDVLRLLQVQAEVEGLRPAGALTVPAGRHPAFYGMAEGECQVCPTSAGPVRLAAGDGVFLLRAQGHALRPGRGAVLVGRLSVAAGADSPLARSLPELVVCRSPALLGRLAAEVTAARPGWRTVVGRALELLLVEGLRGAEAGSSCPGGWLRGLEDPEVGPALVLLHERFAEPWTVARLAGELAMSRSTFAARFKAAVGQAPLAYLTWWRMHQAAARLREGETAGRAARAVGYEAEPAFSRAFKRLFGQTPGQVRRAARPERPRPTSVLQAELKKRNPFDLPEQEVGLNLLRTVAQHQVEGDALLRRHGLNAAEYNVLRILRGGREELPPEEIRQRMIVAPPDINPLLDRLRSARLVCAGRAGLRIAARGLRTLDALDGPVLEMHRRQLGHLAPGELAELNRLLVKSRQRDG
jgi:AraC-like DNA-binding protein